jgi:hypothetical protein
VRSTGLEPGPGEVTAVYAAMITGLVLVLGLLAVLMWRRRRLGMLPGDDRPFWGLAMLIPLASLLMFLTMQQAPWVRVHGRDDLSLFELHGTAEPVHWLAQTVGGALLVILAGLAVRFRQRVGWAVAVPSLLLAGLLLVDLVVIAVKARRLGDLLIAGRLPTLTPKQLADPPSIGAYEGMGVVLWCIAVLVLALVVVSSVLREHEIRIVTGAAALCAVGVALLPLHSVWALRGDEVVRIDASPLDVLPLGLAPISLCLVVAALLIALPGLGKWWRGVAASAVVAFPVAFGFLIIEAADAAVREMPRLVAELAARNAVPVEQSGEFTLLSMGALLLVPLAGIRGWLVARRRSAVRPSLPDQRVAPGAVSHFTSHT